MCAGKRRMHSALPVIYPAAAHKQAECSHRKHTTQPSGCLASAVGFVGRCRRPIRRAKLDLPAPLRKGVYTGMTINRSLFRSRVNGPNRRSLWFPDTKLYIWPVTNKKISLLFYFSTLRIFFNNSGNQPFVTSQMARLSNASDL